MAREFQMREVGTGRLLGTLRTVDDCAPGAVVLAFKQDRVQVEVVTIDEQAKQPEATTERPKGKAKRR